MRVSRLFIQGPSGWVSPRTWTSTDRDPWINNRLRYWLPRLLIPKSLAFPSVWPAPQNPHTSDYEIVCLKRSGDVEEQAHGSADDRGGQAGGGRAQGRGCGSRSWGEHAHDLRLEVEVRRHGYERGAGSQAAA